MLLPIVAFGSPILRLVAEDIKPDYPNLSTLIDNMFETMAMADGVGLAAPQINLSIRLFVVDASPLESKDEDLRNFKQVFINPQITEYGSQNWSYSEGCLSIPGIHEEVSRPESIKMTWVDEHFQPHEAEFHGIQARIIQHEYDHLDGILFPELLSPLKRRLIKGKLTDITRGKAETHYKMLIP